MDGDRMPTLWRRCCLRTGFRPRDDELAWLERDLVTASARSYFLPYLLQFAALFTIMRLGWVIFDLRSGSDRLSNDIVLLLAQPACFVAFYVLLGARLGERTRNRVRKQFEERNARHEAVQTG